MIEDGSCPLGDDLPLRAIWTPGHTPGHLCFADERYNLMLTGDHVLPRITPNISPSPVTADDTLGIFLRSLSELARFDPDEVLPAHESRFSGLPARIRQPAAAVTGDTRGPFCSRGRGHLPRPRSRLARCQRWPREPWSAEGDERHRELPHRGSRWARRTLRGLCTHHDRLQQLP